MFAVRIRNAVTLAALALAVTGCNDHSTSPDDAHEEDIEAVRITLTVGPNTWGPYVIEPNDDPPTLDVPSGVSAMTIAYLDADQDAIDVEDDVTISIDNVVPAGRIGQFQRTSATSGFFTGVVLGTAKFTLCVKHGSHCDFSVDNVSVNVVPLPVD